MKRREEKKQLLNYYCVPSTHCTRVPTLHAERPSTKSAAEIIIICVS